MTDSNQSLSLRLDTQKARKELEQFKARVNRKPLTLDLSLNSDHLLSKTKKDISQLAASLHSSLNQITDVDIRLNIQTGSSPVPKSILHSMEAIQKSAAALSRQLQQLGQFPDFDAAASLGSASKSFQSLDQDIKTTGESYSDFVNKLINTKDMISSVVKDKMNNILIKKNAGRFKGEPRYFCPMPGPAKYA